MNFEIIEFLKTVDWFNWVKALIIVLMGVIVVKISINFLSRLVDKKLATSHKVLLNRIISIVLLAVFISSALQQLDFDITALLGAAGIITIVIGIAAQSTLGNLFSGFFLLIERSIKIGDVIKINGIMGEILNISLFSIKIKTTDGIYMQIPNETLAKSQVLNYSYFSIRRIDLIIKVPYSQNLTTVEQILLHVVQDAHKILKHPPPFVQSNQFLDNGFEVGLFCWVLNDDFGSVTHYLIKSIQQKFFVNNIEFMFFPLKILGKNL